MKLRQRIFHFVVTAAAIWFALFAHSQTLSDFSPVSAWDLSKRAVPISERQTVNGDGYGGDGFTVLPLLKENETPCTAIIIHGLGGTGQEWGYLSLGLSFFSLNYVKFIIPSASNQSVTYLKTTMPSWFDIRSIRGRDADVDRADLLSSVGRINKIIDGEIRRGVPEKRIFVIGFSQGGALSLTTFLRSRRKLAGCVGVATWLPLDREYGSSGNVTVPAGKSDVLMIHVRVNTDNSVPLVNNPDVSFALRDKEHFRAK